MRLACLFILDLSLEVNVSFPFYNSLSAQDIPLSFIVCETADIDAYCQKYLRIILGQQVSDLHRMSQKFVLSVMSREKDQLINISLVV